MSLHKLSTIVAMSSVWAERQVLWTSHWFKTWTQAQRGEFLKELVYKSHPGTPKSDVGAQQSHTLDMAMRGLSMDEQRPDIFRCQLELFCQWFDGWEEQDKNALVEKLRIIDPEFIEQLSRGLATIPNGCN